MQRRVINILNSKGQRRTFKFLDEGNDIIVYGEDPNFVANYDENGNIINICYDNGPTLEPKGVIFFQERGSFRIVEILPISFSISNKPNCYFLGVFKIKDDKKEKRR